MCCVSIEIELALPAETRGKDFACAVSREGAMCIEAVPGTGLERAIRQGVIA